MFKSLFLPLIGVAAFITLVGLLTQGKFDSILKKTTTNINSELKVIKIDNVEVEVEVAKTNSERAKGLSNRDSLGEGNGMIFVFEENSEPIFWMKDTRIALDIIWINDDKIVGVDRNVEPEPNKKDSDLTRYPSPSVVDYVLEVNGGFSDSNNIRTGQTLSGLEQL